MPKAARSSQNPRRQPAKYAVGKFTNWKKVGAPLVEPDIHELGDKRLNPEEAVAREREALLKMESKKRIHGQDDLEKSDRSLGPRLYFTEILRRIRAMNPRVAVRDGVEGNVALYYPKRHDEYKPGDFDDLPPGGVFFAHHKYVGGMLKDWLPEWGHVTNDTSNVAHREVRGWRSVLIQLVKQHVITYREAIEGFGDPLNDSRSKYWYEQLGKFIH